MCIYPEYRCYRFLWNDDLSLNMDCIYYSETSVTAYITEIFGSHNAADIDFVFWVMIPYRRGPQPGARGHHCVILISVSALWHIYELWKVLADSLCVCSLAKSKSTVVIVDEKRLRTPAVWCVSCYILTTFLKKASPKCSGTYRLHLYSTPKVDTKGCCSKFRDLLQHFTVSWTRIPQSAFPQLQKHGISITTNL
jgi:hypothetical protein